jgi:hypothetical protein
MQSTVVFYEDSTVTSTMQHKQGSSLSDEHLKIISMAVCQVVQQFQTKLAVYR